MVWGSNGGKGCCVLVERMKIALLEILGTYVVGVGRFESLSLTSSGCSDMYTRDRIIIECSYAIVLSHGMRS